MSEPGAVSGTVSQTNDQGVASNTHHPSFTVTATGTDVSSTTVPSGGVGFSNSDAIPAADGTGATGEHDEIRGEEFEGDQVSMGQQMFSMDNLPESPYYTYNTRVLSSGVGQTDQRYHASRELGRGMNKTNIRNGVYYDERESDLFTWDLNVKQPNITKAEVEDATIEDVRDV